MKINTQEVWVIMSRDRKFIAKGTPRNRYIVAVDNERDKKRFLTYGSKRKAEAGFSTGFFHMGLLSGYDPSIGNWKELLEAVQCEMQIKTV